MHIPCFSKITRLLRNTKEAERYTSKISEESSTRTLSHVISHVKNPKPQHESHDRPRLNPPPFSIPKRPPDIRRVSYDQNGDSDGHGSCDDKRSPATVLALTPVAAVADERLHEQSRERAAEPDHAGPSVWDPELLHVRSEEGELERPAELDPARDGSYAEEHALRDLWSSNGGTRRRIRRSWQRWTVACRSVVTRLIGSRHLTHSLSLFVSVFNESL